MTSEKDLTSTHPSGTVGDMTTEQTPPTHISATVVREALELVYGSGPMVTALADDIVDRWDVWLADEYKDLETNLVFNIWDWFAGGTTAEHAAQQVLLAVDAARES